MQITLPAAVERDLPPARAALHLAIGLFTAEEATLGQAARIANLSQAEFVRELGRRRLSIHYGREEFVEDLATLSRIATR
jgi:predicted HTH domain antitoxin